jgi:glycosyltransferase involved in cell wall biosynthesis
VLPGYPWQPVGGFRVVYEYASRLAARGHAVTVVHPRRLRGVRRPAPKGAVRRLLRPLGDLRHNVRQRLTRPEIWWQGVHPAVELRYVAEPTPPALPDADAVFATAWQTASYVNALSPGKGARFYLVMDFPPYLGPAEAIAASWRLPLAKISISRWLEGLVREAGADDVVTIPIGVGDGFREAPVGVAVSDRGPRVAMMVGRSPYKAWRDGLEALRLARARVAALEAELYGPGPIPAGLEPWIRYHRNVGEGELIALLDRSAAFLCSSLAEGFALPPAEAALRGCAIVTTDCGGNREYAVAGETALVAPPGDPAALAARLVRVLEDPSLRQRLAARGRERVLEFSWDRAVDRLETRLLATVG